MRALTLTALIAVAALLAACGDAQEDAADQGSNALPVSTDGTSDVQVGVPDGGEQIAVPIGDAHDAAADEMADTMREIADVLAGVTDVATAEAAKSRLEDLGERMKDVMKRADALGEPSPERQTALMAKMKGAAEGFQKQMMRVMGNPELAGALGDALGAFGG